jgi:hypothetical protein
MLEYSAHLKYELVKYYSEAVIVGRKAIGTLHKLFSKSRVARAPVGVVRTPPKLGSSTVPIAKSTLNPDCTSTASDKILSLLLSKTKVVPLVASTYGFLDIGLIENTTSATCADAVQ